jgi:hypothetical protein
VDNIDKKKDDPLLYPAIPMETPAEDSADLKEIGGRVEGLPPTRYQTWEKNGREIDF